MEIKTKIFGDVNIDDDKIILFPNGIIGFPDLQHFTLIHDEEKEGNNIHWLQSVEEPGFAMPVMDPLLVAKDYNPEVEDNHLIPLGEMTAEDTLVLVTVTVPKDLTQMSVNLQAPIIINADSKKATQIIVNSEKYPIKFYIYDILQKMKKEGE